MPAMKISNKQVLGMVNASDTLDFTFMAELVKSLELVLLELPPAPTKS
jgi:hypothetical protein